MCTWGFLQQFRCQYRPNFERNPAQRRISSLRFETSIQLFYFMIAGLILVIRECNILCVLSLRIILMCLYVSRQLPSSCPSLTRITYLSCPVAISVLFENADPLKKQSQFFKPKIIVSDKPKPTWPTSFRFLHPYHMTEYSRQFSFSV